MQFLFGGTAAKNTLRDSIIDMSGLVTEIRKSFMTNRKKVKKLFKTNRKNRVGHKTRTLRNSTTDKFT